MKNIEASVEKNILTVRIDLTKEFGLSSTKKTVIVASTEGNMAVPGHEEIKVGINAYKPKKG
jgi:hypothetical protein